MINKNSNSYDSLIERVAEQIKKIKGVQAVILFGSYARGTAKGISDIDICVLADRKISEKIKDEICSFSSQKLDISIFWDLSPSMRFQIVKEGKMLFSSSEESMHIAKAETFKEYQDFKHILDRNIERVFRNE